MSRYTGGGSTTTTSSQEDEELARRLQFAEQSQPLTSNNNGYSSQQELQDRELAREFVQLDMLQGSSHSQSSSLRRRTYSSDDDMPSQRIRGDTSPRRRPTHSRNRSFSPTATMMGLTNPLDGYASPQRRSPRRGYSTDRESPRRTETEDGEDDPFDYRMNSPRRRTAPHKTATQSPKTPQQQTQHVRSRSAGPIDQTLLARAGLSYDSPVATTTPNKPTTSSTTTPSVDFVRLFQVVSQQSAATTTSDEDLARRMQDLEDRGMGQMNSDRSLGSSAFDDSKVEDSAKPSPRSQSDLAHLIAESGANLNDIPDDVWRELLGPTASQQLRRASIEPADSSIENSPTITALRSALSGVDPADIESRAQQLGRSEITKTNDETPSTSIEMLRIPLSPSDRVESAPEPINGAPKSAGSPTDTASTGASPSKQKKKRRGLLNKLTGRSSRDDADGRKKVPPVPALDDRKPGPVPGPAGGLPAAIPPPPGGSISSSVQRTFSSMRQTRSVSPVPAAVGGKKGTISGIPTGIPAAGIHGVKPSAGHARNNSFNGSFRGTSVCAACGMTHGSFLKAFDRKYHPECFRCTSCQGKIDPNDQFKYTTDQQGRKHPHHRECFIGFGVSCAVCNQKLPMTAEGRVPFIKHPFFDNEKMCVRHADEAHRRCAGCQRFEPKNVPFIDIMDGDRCVCPACCRSVVVDNADAKPLWNQVLAFFENFLKLPVWGPLRELPILLVGSETLLEQMNAQNHNHASSMHPMTAGLCLTEPGRGDNVVSRYYLDAPAPTSSMALQPKTKVISILCLTGLPSDLTASVLAHEAAHAWIRLHPQYDPHNPLPAQVEEGVAQLVAMLFLSEGLGPPPPPKPEEEDGPSDEKLRQYFKFCIERETSEVYGTGYRRAAVAYRDIGIEALLTHVLQYRDFPVT